MAKPQPIPPSLDGLYNYIRIVFPGKDLDAIWSLVMAGYDTGRADGVFTEKMLHLWGESHD